MGFWEVGNILFSPSAKCWCNLREDAGLMASNVCEVSVRSRSCAQFQLVFFVFFPCLFSQSSGCAEAREPSVTNVRCTCFCFYSSRKTNKYYCRFLFSLFLSSASSKKGPVSRTKPTIEVYCQQTCLFHIIRFKKKKKEKCQCKHKIFAILYPFQTNPS